MGAPSGKTLRFTHLDIENWKNFTKADVELQRRVFLIGPNASGKSNLLDVFRFLRDIVAVGGGFQAAARSRGGLSRIRCLAARRQPNVSIKINIGDDANPARWIYEIQFRQDHRQRPFLDKERIISDGEELLSRPNPEDIEDPERLTQTYLEQVSANKDFREIADLFQSVRYLHLVPQLVRDPDRSIGRTDDPYGGDFLERIAQVPEKTRKSRLAKILSALKVAAPQFEELAFMPDERGIPHLQGRYAHWRPNGAWQNEVQFSDGTLRLIGLLWAILDGSGPLLLEEPELSLHAEVIRYLPQMLARFQRSEGRQILTSTHSENLLNDPGIGLNEVIILRPGENGATVSLAKDEESIVQQVESGLSLAEIVIPRTSPENVERIGLFGG